MTSKKHPSVQKLKTHIPGFDSISYGGLPQGRSTLVCGTTGSAKTVFAVQFLAAGITQAQENGVFITFEEAPQDIRQNMLGFGWDIAAWETAGGWIFVDASPEPDQETMVVGDFDLGALLARIEYAVRKHSAKRVSLDSISTIFTRFDNETLVRSELYRIARALKKMGITAVLTAEQTHDFEAISRHGVEEFVADNVIILRNVLEEEKRRRTVEILKFRGTAHQKGEFPFTVSPAEGLIVIPLSAMDLKQKSSTVRISSGNSELDKMCGGGFFRDSTILVSGATGTGKTLMVSEFIAGGAAGNERCLLFAFEESWEQLFRNAGGWGIDFERMQREDRLKVVCEYPEVFGLEDHLIRMKKIINDFKPQRVALDSLSALERASSRKGFREFVLSLTSFIRNGEMTGLFTTTTPTLLGGTSVTEAHISTITDTTILLRYVEMFGEIRRGLIVLKMRGSIHDTNIRQFTIDGRGMHIGRPFRNIAGIMAGNPSLLGSGEIEQMQGLFGHDQYPAD